MNVDEVIRRLRIIQNHLKTNQAGLAAYLGVSPPFICGVLSGERSPSTKICEAVGLKRVITVEEDNTLPPNKFTHLFKKETS